MCSCACEAHMTIAYLETDVFVQYATVTCLSGPRIVTTLSSHSGVGSSILILVPVSFRKSRMISPPYQQVKMSAQVPTKETLYTG